MTRPLIILVNDDGVHSPGLAALAFALDNLGELMIVAPRNQQSGAGRSMLGHHTGELDRIKIQHREKEWSAYAVDASPALCVQHAILELADRPPALVASGINYGENVGVSSGTISGTVGAALEGAAHHVPSLAVSLQVDSSLHSTHDHSVDFTTAAHFGRVFAGQILEGAMPVGVDVLKVEVPALATINTAWKVARLDPKPYYIPVAPDRTNNETKNRMGYRLSEDRVSDSDTDSGTLEAGLVAVTPLQLDMTVHDALEKLDTLLRS